MVSYSAVDGESAFRQGVAEYLTCGNDSVTIDLYGESADQCRICLCSY